MVLSWEHSKTTIHQAHLRDKDKASSHFVLILTPPLDHSSEPRYATNQRSAPHRSPTSISTDRDTRSRFPLCCAKTSHACDPCRDPPRITTIPPHCSDTVESCVRQGRVGDGRRSGTGGRCWCSVFHVLGDEVRSLRAFHKLKIDLAGPPWIIRRSVAKYERRKSCPLEGV